VSAPADPGEVLKRILRLQQKGRLAEAAALAGKLAKRVSADARLLNLTATLALQAGDAEEATALFERSLAMNPAQPQAQSNRSVALERLGRFDEALEASDKAVALQPDYAKAHANRGNLLNALGRPEDALAACDRALALDPGLIEAVVNRGNALRSLGRAEEALASFDAALAKAPDLAVLHLDRGNTLHDLGRDEEAIAEFDRTLALAPDNADAFTCRGNAERNLMRLDAAAADHRRALALKPDSVEARWNLALVELLSGDFANGWRDYEERWRRRAMRGQTPYSSAPLWLGEPPSLTGKSILLVAEQGLGDTIQFCRYTPLVAERGPKVTLAVPKALLPLVATMKGAISFATTDAPPPVADFQVPLMSLPLAFGTAVETIPASVPYLFADPQRQATWHGKLGEKRRPRIGLCWSGRAGLAPDRHRSMSAQSLAPLLALPFEFHSLQKEIRPADRETLKAFPQVATHTDELGDFADTAALIAEMDLTVSVDTSIAHAVGALGRPLWLLPPLMPEWRWLTGRNDSPWYPTARLFRKRGTEGWDGIIAAVVRALETEFRT
jgi:tetratricopeptide (TPR) repeat protein